MKTVLAAFRRTTFINLQLPHNTDKSWHVQPGYHTRQSTQWEPQPRSCQQTKTGRGITAFLGISKTGAWHLRDELAETEMLFFRHSVVAVCVCVWRQTRVIYGIKLKVNEKTEVVVLVGLFLSQNPCHWGESSLSILWQIWTQNMKI